MDDTAQSPRVPPGFRFHPTDEELVDYYLKRKVEAKSIDLDVIRDIDLYRLEPWDLQEQCRIGHEEQTEWYFFSHKDKKYPTGTRTNRATVEGFWKATGRDKAIYAKLKLIGMRKTLVFYKGRAPNGQKTDWIMHEYRLETSENAAPQEEGWVVCRAFRKRASHAQHAHAHALKRATLLQSTSNFYRDFSSSLDHPHNHYNDYSSFMPMPLPHVLNQRQRSTDERFDRLDYQRPYACKQEEQLNSENPKNLDYQAFHNSFLQLPQLESPKLPSNANSSSCSSAPPGTQGTVAGGDHSLNSNLAESVLNIGAFLPALASPEQQQQQQQAEKEQRMTDWKVLDKFVASQLMDSSCSAHNQVQLPSSLLCGSPLSMASDSVMASLLLRQNPKTAESPDCEASSSVCQLQDDDLIWGGFPK
eukprot:TRINITY_DN6521_c0_g1_i1.p1 TRINITY_DN6521_c0_g1~~TRINITY_DN6521_c0_g1_i1.p1  ORF type:complete len:417 (-),score=39.87 TRINITY_DN6521_c0_g1_i1:368-1618(-)